MIGISEDLVVPDRNLSVYDDAVACWKGEKMGQWKQMSIAASGAASFPVHKPYCQLTEQERSWLWHGGAGGFEGSTVSSAWWRKISTRYSIVCFRPAIVARRSVRNVTDPGCAPMRPMSVSPARQSPKW